VVAVEAAAHFDTDVLVRSAHKESSHEFSMAATNLALAGVCTSFVWPESSTAWISSSMIRDLLSDGRTDDVRQMVPEPVFAAMSVGPPLT
jgi:phosphopantetheine adenylyltransferase